MSVARRIRRTAELRQAKAARAAAKEAAVARAAAREEERRHRAENPPTAEQRRAMLGMGRTMMGMVLGAALR